MKSRKFKRRLGKGALSIIALLFFASGIIRFAGSAGPVLARGLDNVEFARAEAKSAGVKVCETDGDLRGAIRVLQDRADELDRREESIEHRFQTLAMAEKEIRLNLSALAEAEDALKSTLALADGAAESDIDKLAKVYEAMKPKDAAAVFEEMDPRFAAGFLARMAPAAAASVLSGLSSEKAYTVSVVLAGRNSDVPTN
ncbi:MotE family protein [Tropicimonas marinistellae]|uniref:MotE family protein n=1 Tax=Tropicimonas marinistellae TaxID=1739787 RepID=UPI00083251D0|nr:hypothetical protein [Tropicimonas marinistellae]